MVFKALSENFLSRTDYHEGHVVYIRDNLAYARKCTLVRGAHEHFFVIARVGSLPLKVSHTNVKPTHQHIGYLVTLVAYDIHQLRLVCAGQHPVKYGCADDQRQRGIKRNRT